MNESPRAHVMSETISEKPILNSCKNSLVTKQSTFHHLILIMQIFLPCCCFIPLCKTTFCNHYRDEHGNAIKSAIVADYNR